MSSTCCAGNCGCGPSCKCGSSCGGCKMNPDMSYSENTSTVTPVVGVAPTHKIVNEGTEMAGAGAENGSCKCNPCSCNPCTCK